MSGCVEAIFIAPSGGDELHAVDDARLIEGKGIEGDRYFSGTGTWSKRSGTGRHVTLIEIEALEGAAREYGVELALHESRRNIVTRDVALNHLVGRRFRIGEAVLEGMRLAEPCKYLESRTQPGARKSFVHRGGLRADVIESGIVRVGDAVRMEWGL